MPILTHCPSCQSRCGLPDDFAGKAFRCKKCQKLFRMKAPQVGQEATPEVIAAATPQAAVPNSSQQVRPTSPTAQSIQATVSRQAEAKVVAAPPNKPAANDLSKLSRKSPNLSVASRKRKQRRFVQILVVCFVGVGLPILAGAGFAVYLAVSLFRPPKAVVRENDGNPIKPPPFVVVANKKKESPAEAVVRRPPQPRPIQLQPVVPEIDLPTAWARGGLDNVLPDVDTRPIPIDLEAYTKRIKNHLA